MARIVHEKYVRTYWVDTIADISAPTVAEITGGTYLGTEQTADGLSESPTNNRASVEMLDTDKIPEYPGTHSLQITAKFTREDVEADDVAWELFDHDTAGYLVVARLRKDADPEAGDRVEVYQARSHEPQNLSTAANTFQQYEVPFALQDWNKKAVVAA